MRRTALPNCSSLSMRANALRPLRSGQIESMTGSDGGGPAES
jgi:hypothetical protein